MSEHTHCWHDATPDETPLRYADGSTRWDEVCCHCGELRRVTVTHHRDGHGEFLPKDARPGCTVTYTETPREERDRLTTLKAMIRYG